MERNGWSREVLVCLAASSMLWSIPSSAQTEAKIGSIIQKPAAARIATGPMSDNDRARATLVAYATCVAKRSRRAVEQVLSIPALTEESGTALVRLSRSGCLYEGALTMDRSLLRGALFVALYRIDYGAAPASAALAAQPVDYSGDAAGLTTKRATSYVALRDFASCVARRDPEGSRRAVLAPIGRAAESAAYARLSAAMGGCMPQGLTLSFNKAVLHGLLGEALYRETRSG